MKPDGFACDLDECDLQKRGTDWATLAVHVMTKQRIGNRFLIVYDSEATEVLRSLLDAERVCCSWATWTCETTDEGEGMEVTGPPGLIAALAEAFGVKQMGSQVVNTNSRHLTGQLSCFLVVKRPWIRLEAVVFRCRYQL